MKFSKETLDGMDNLSQLISRSEAGRVFSIPARLQLDESLYLWLIMLSGAVFRFLTLGRQSLWVDEGLSYWIANQSWADFQVFLQGSVRPLHYAILRLMILLGGNEWMLRAPSAIAGVISVGLFYALVSECFDRKTGLIAALLLAVSPFHVWYSQEARMYAVESAFMLAAALFAVRGFRRNYWRDWFLFGLFEGLALLTETGAIWFVLSFNFAAGLIFFFKRQTGKFRPWVFSQSIAFFAYFPVLLNIPAGMKSGDTDWIPPATLESIVRLLADFVAGHYHSALQGILILAAIFILIFAAASKLNYDYRSHSSRYILLASWLLVPVGISFLISQEYFRVPFRDLIFAPGVYIFLSRNLITVMFPLYMLVARGLILTRRDIGMAVLTAIIALNFMNYIQYDLGTTKEDFRSAARLVSERVREGDSIILAPGMLEAPFAYYFFDRSEIMVRPARLFKDGVIDATMTVKVATFQEALSNSVRVWLVTSGNIYQPDREGITQKVEARGEKLDEIQVHGVKIDLYRLEP